MSNFYPIFVNKKILLSDFLTVDDICPFFVQSFFSSNICPTYVNVQRLSNSCPMISNLSYFCESPIFVQHLSMSKICPTFVHFPHPSLINEHPILFHQLTCPPINLYLQRWAKKWSLGSENFLPGPARLLLSKAGLLFGH